MKKTKIFNSVIITLLLVTAVTFLSCIKNNDEDKTGFVTFGANFHIINCITTVSIYIDGEFIGKLENYTNGISDCNQPENITKEITIGEHKYKIEIRPDRGDGCTKDIEEPFIIVENECEKVFIDYSTIDFEH